MASRQSPPCMDEHRGRTRSLQSPPGSRGLDRVGAVQALRQRTSTAERRLGVAHVRARDNPERNRPEDPEYLGSSHAWAQNPRRADSGRRRVPHHDHVVPSSAVRKTDGLWRWYPQQTPSRCLIVVPSTSRGPSVLEQSSCAIRRGELDGTPFSESGIHPRSTESCDPLDSVQSQQVRESSIDVIH